MLSAGTHLGPYEIVSPLGAGGMGEVYRARDTRLDRTVAIKVLPEHLSQQPENRERFVREARAISVLNHPHICTLHDVGQQDGWDYLVMEFVEGETLSARLERGAMPVHEALRSGIEIADALAKAHREGIVHRDLKPGNVMLTKSGVKLLDFGLAKALPTAGDRDAALTAMATSSRPLTGQDRIVGTLHYMAPEQLEGKDADARSDIFAFGAVLYEMVTGKKAFDAKSAASVIAAILEHEPPSMNELQPMAPPVLERVVKVCLAKDPDDRWQTAHDVQLELTWILEGGSQAGLPAPLVVHRKKRERAAWMLAAICAFMFLGVVTAYVRLVTIRPPVLISSIAPPPGARFAFVGPHSGVPQISPDGRMLLFVATDAEGTNALWVRPLDSPSARPLVGTEDVELPFWSADSRSIGFFAGGKLKTIPAMGGPVVPLCDVSVADGGSWNQEGVILFETALDSGLYQIAASGGSPKLVLSFDKSKFNAYVWPKFLPDGKHFTYTAFGTEAYTGTYFGSLDGHENKLIGRATGNVVFSSGFLFYTLPTGSTTDLMAEAFDPATGRVKGEPQLIVQGVEFQQGPDQAAFGVSDRLLVYQASPTGTAATHNLVWLDRSGKKLSVVAPGHASYDLRLSPDGQRLAYSKGAPNSDIWVQELKRDVPMRVTFDSSVDKGSPVWSPDGNEIVFDVATGGKTPSGIYRKSSSSTGAERLVAQPDKPDLILWPTDWSRDGRFILGVQGEIVSRSRGEIWVLPTSGDGKPRIFVRAPSAAYDGQFSPDGHWVAYVSKESGREEVYVVPFDGNQVLTTQPMQEVVIAKKWQVSAKGGAFPRWRRDGQELFYVGPGSEFMATKIEEKGNAFSVSEARPLFRESLGDAASPYDVSPDGQHFVVNSFGETGAMPLTLVENWKESLKK